MSAVFEWVTDTADDAATVGRFGPVAVAVLRAPIDRGILDRLDGSLSRARDESSGSYSAIVVRAGTTPQKMAPAHRGRAREILSAHRARLLGFAYVLRGGGLKGRMIRGAMNAVLAGARIDAKTFESVDDAIRWLGSRPGQDPALRDHARGLADAIETARG